MQQQPFHLVEYRPWPCFVGTLCLILPTSFVLLLAGGNASITFLSIAGLGALCFFWWRDADREATTGFHGARVQMGLKTGFFLFILREVIFFFSFFWRFFHNALAPDIRIGVQWPPVGITPLVSFQIPLLNTAILLLRGVRVTWAHHRHEANKGQESNVRLFLTVLLGATFLGLQGAEYFEASFSLADGIYGSTFFLLTGFHGLHVIVGTAMLLTAFVRHLKQKASAEHHIGLLVRIWYWHFVDVVWLFLFVCIYWWGS